MRSPILAAHVFLCLLWAAGAHAEGFVEGDVIGGYVVTGVTTHPEFHRIEVSGSQGSLEVEITYADRAPSLVASEHYVVQPAPGSPPLPADLVEAVHAALLEMESEPEHAPFVSRMERGTGALPGASVGVVHGEAWADLASKIRFSFPFLGAAVALRFIVPFALRRRRANQTAA